MRAHYDFASMPSRKNPYAARLKQPVTIRLDRGTVAYFKAMALKTGLPYQHLINLYLRDCASRGLRISVGWSRPPARRVKAAHRSRAAARRA